MNKSGQQEKKDYSGCTIRICLNRTIKIMEGLTILIVDLLPDGDVRERDVTAPGSPEYAHVSSLSVLGGNNTYSLHRMAESNPQ